jgi:hypothetical protein
MSNELVPRNLQAFERHQPALAEQLKGIGPTASVLERGDGGTACNILIGSERLYPGPARDWAAQQVTGLLAEGERVVFDDARHCNVSEYWLPFYRRLVDFCAAREDCDLAGAPLVDAGYVFVFGIGLGWHIEELLRRSPARTLILVEPIVEFLYHSLSAVDWEALFDFAESLGRRIHIITTAQPDDICRAIEAILVAEGNFFIDGSYFYFHYNSWALDEAGTQLALNIRHHYYSTGFFEDEKKMMTNACANMRRHAFHICEDQPFLRQTTPVFVIGSGPSLDNDLDFIRHWRDKVILISSGTALGILLKHGLRPDLHTEMENGPQIFPILAPLRDKYGFDGIRLGASLTVDPAVSGLFDRRWFFLRAALSPSLLLSPFHKVLMGSDPTVSNASFSIATVAGFTDIYLFGVDCGYREGTDEQHHSQHSIYFTEDKPEGTDDIVQRHDRLLPGNFGGKFRTQWSFDLTARGIAELRRHHPALRLFNCSDGARIDGAQPKAAEAIDLSHLPDRSARVLDQVEQQMACYQAGDLLRRLDGRRQVAGCRSFAQAVDAVLESLDADRDGFYELHQRLRCCYQSQGPESLGAIAVAGATLMNMLRAAAFQGIRIADVPARRAYIRFAAAETRRQAAMLFDDTANLFETLLADVPPAA